MIIKTLQFITNPVTSAIFSLLVGIFCVLVGVESAGSNVYALIIRGMFIASGVYLLAVSIMELWGVWR